MAAKSIRNRRAAAPEPKRQKRNPLPYVETR